MSLFWQPKSEWYLSRRGADLGVRLLIDVKRSISVKKWRILEQKNCRKMTNFLKSAMYLPACLINQTGVLSATGTHYKSFRRYGQERRNEWSPEPIMPEKCWAHLSPEYPYFTTSSMVHVQYKVWAKLIYTDTKTSRGLVGVFQHSHSPRATLKRRGSFWLAAALQIIFRSCSAGPGSLDCPIIWLPGAMPMALSIPASYVLQLSCWPNLSFLELSRLE